MPKRPWTTSEERVCNEALRMRAADATDGEIAAVIPDRSVDARGALGQAGAPFMSSSTPHLVLGCTDAPCVGGNFRLPSLI